MTKVRALGDSCVQFLVGDDKISRDAGRGSLHLGSSSSIISSSRIIKTQGFLHFESVTSDQFYRKTVMFYHVISVPNNSEQTTHPNIS